MHNRLMNEFVFSNQIFVNLNGEMTKPSKQFICVNCDVQFHIFRFFVDEIKSKN